MAVSKYFHSAILKWNDVKLTTKDGFPDSFPLRSLKIIIMPAYKTLEGDFRFNSS